MWERGRGKEVRRKGTEEKREIERMRKGPDGRGERIFLP